MHGDNNDVHTDDQHELRPVLAEILRTCTHPETFLLRVEQIIHEDVADDDVSLRSAHRHERTTAHSVRLHVTDGQLLVQALIRRQVLGTVNARNMRAGDLVEVYGCSVKRARKRNGVGHIIYLSIDDCHMLTFRSGPTEIDKNGQIVPDFPSAQLESKLHDGAFDGMTGIEADTAGRFSKDTDRAANTLLNQNPSANSAHLQRVSVDDIYPSIDKDLSEDFVRGLQVPISEHSKTHGPTSQHIVHNLNTTDRAEQSPPRTSLKRKKRDDSFDDEYGDLFEIAEVDVINQVRREGVMTNFDERDHGIQMDADITRDDRNDEADADLGAIRLKDDDHGLVKRTPRSASRLHEGPCQHGKISSHRLPEAPLHTLASLLNPPKSHSLPRKNYRLNVLAVITHVGSSLITRPGSSFPPKRHIKIEDPSLHQGKYQNPQTKAITIAVYRDAANFKPAVGTTGLFRGLVMQRLPNRDIMLNVYAAPHLQAGTSKTPAHNAHSRDLGIASSPAQDLTTTSLCTPQDQLDDNDWFVTSPALLTQLGHDVEGIENWWRSSQKDRTKY